MTLTDIITQTSIALLWERLGYLDKRNEIARSIFANRANRKRSIGATTVETWYDRENQLYVTQTVTADGSDVPNDYSGHRDDAAVAHLWALHAASKRFVAEAEARGFTVAHRLTAPVSF
jgi:hypothetical protein